jgi:hypothetical protein
MNKRRITKYTAFMPKTLKAAKKTRHTFIKKIDCFLKNTTKRIKKIPNTINKRTVKSIRFLTKK